MIRNRKLNAQSVQGIVEKFYASLTSWKELRKSNPRARMPKKRKWFYVIPYKEKAIRVIDGRLILSNGKGNEPLMFDWQHEKPKYVEISYDEGYVLNAVYMPNKVPEIEVGDIAGIDLGEVHIAVARTESVTTILNGRELRSKSRYLNKVKASFQSMMQRCKKGSKRHRRLAKAKKRMCKRLNNQIKDVLHKQTTKLISTLRERDVKTVAIGDIRNIRLNCDKGAYTNQKIHQMRSGRARKMLTYKALLTGMETVMVNEAYTTKTCPRCLSRNECKGRNYKCPICAFEYHRDGVGAINIRQKQKYRGFVPVVGEMAPPVGIRYVA